MFRIRRRKLFDALAGFCPARDGAIAVLVAILLPVLIGGMALAIDLSRAANLQTELQDAADAAALAGATQLDLTDGARARAIQAAAREVTRIIENSQRYGDTYESVVIIDGTVDIPSGQAANNTDINFFVDLETKTPALSDDTANFIEVNVAPRTVTYLFAGFIGLVDANPIARAVAGFEQLICSEQPMMMCNPEEPDNGGDGDPAATFDVNAYKGSGVTMKASTGADLVPGDFGFLQVNESSQNGVICLNLAGINSTAQQCLGKTVDGKGGTITTLGDCLNVRFDIYPNNGGPQNVLSGARTDSNFAPAVNVVKGLVHPDQALVGGNVTIPSASSCRFNVVGVGGTDWERPQEIATPLQEYLGPGGHLDDGSNLPATMSYPNDDCYYGAAPTCNFGLNPAPTPQDQIGDGAWDIGTYAATQHSSYGSTGNPNGNGITDPGPAFQAEVNGWLIAEGLDFNGDGNLGLPSRYEVYLWELDLANELPESLDANASCSTELAGVERRVITVAVVNCTAAPNNKQDMPLATPGAVDIFLTEPVGATDTNNFYAEIIGPAATSLNSKSVARKRVIIYE